MKYVKILGEALRGRRVRHEDFCGGNYTLLGKNGYWGTGNGEYNNHILSSELMRSDKWEVEPRNLEQLIFYGACEDDGTSFLFENPPEKTEDGDWNCEGSFWHFDDLNLFPKDRYVEYKIITKEEYEGKND